VAERRAYAVTVRSGARVRKERFAALEAALEAIEQEGRELERTAHARNRGGTFIRKLEPVQQVVARLELSGPSGLRAGVDVRGDGSAEAWTGRVRRRLIEPREGEDAYAALRRVVVAQSTSVEP
jgi:hypothetical protein